MATAREMAWMYAPFVNSYKRYQLGSWAPTAIVWSRDNRTCGYRTVGEHTAFRVECRIPGADANPYLAFAATVAARHVGHREQGRAPADVRGQRLRGEATCRGCRRACTRRSTCSASRRRRKEMFGDFVFEHLLNTAVQEQIDLRQPHASPTGSSPATSSAADPTRDRSGRAPTSTTSTPVCTTSSRWLTHPHLHRDHAAVGLRSRPPHLGHGRHGADRIAGEHRRDEPPRGFQVDAERPFVGRRRLPARDRRDEQPVRDRGVVGRALGDRVDVGVQRVVVAGEVGERRDVGRR